jgi:penicillin amidase
MKRGAQPGPADGRRVRPIVRRWLARAIGLGLLGGHVLGYAARHRGPRREVGLAERLAAIPTQGLPLTAPVTVHWDDHQIPFAEAACDDDLAVAFGAIHAHLRWAQMAIMRRISQGRVAEMIGPLGFEIDHALRLLGFREAGAAAAASIAPETRRWLEGFVGGINHVVAHAPALPEEFDLLGLAREPWSVEDVLVLGRLVAVDVNWLVWLALLQFDGDAAGLWQRFARVGSELGLPEPGLQPDSAALTEALESIGRTGSNSLAVGPGRSGTGAPWIASDPHLSFVMPGTWLIAGGKSPGYHATGLMIPALPFVALGRNPWIAWGGTNLHAASSDLVDVAGLPPQAIETRRERVRVRWGGEREIAIRRTAHGPLLSDLPFLRRAKPCALRWVGQRPSDEIGAMLRVNRARDWPAFRAALEGFAVPGQNMVYADAAGHIGKAMAARLPRRPLDGPPDLLAAPATAAQWAELIGAADLPASFDPASGYVASANERPEAPPVVIGHLFAPPERHQRLEQLLDRRQIGFAELAGVQRDVLSLGALKFRDLLVERLGRLAEANPPEEPARRLLKELAAWEGRYDVESAGALAFEALVYRLAAALRGRERLRLYGVSWNPQALIREDLERASREQVDRALLTAVRTAARDLARRRSWGAIHRLSLQHMLAAAPFLARRFRFGAWPVAGSSSTVFKTAHRMTSRPHRAGYGSNARHIADLSDLDCSYVVILGGQDGWLGSTTFIDQVPLWREGRYIRLPLRPETIRRTYPHRTELRP